MRCGKAHNARQAALAALQVLQAAEWRKLGLAVDDEGVWLCLQAHGLQQGRFSLNNNKHVGLCCGWRVVDGDAQRPAPRPAHAALLEPGKE